MLEDNIDARLTLAFLLLEEAKEEDTISLLALPKNFWYLILKCSIIIFVTTTRSSFLIMSFGLYVQTLLTYLLKNLNPGD